MLLLLILLLQWRVTTCVSSPTLEDNMLPTDEEVLSDLINSYRGQPEQEITLNLPSDEEAFNEIRPILQSGNPLYYIGGGSGHFVSSSFPEIDSRGFHESVFDNFNDFYPPVHRGKKYDSSVSVSARGFYGDVFTDGFGSFHPVKRTYRNQYAQPFPSSRQYLPKLLRTRRSMPLDQTSATKNISDIDHSQRHSLNEYNIYDTSSQSPLKLCSPEYDENCDINLKVTLEDESDSDKSWKIINHRVQKPVTSNSTYDIRHKRSARELHQKYGPNFWKNYPDLFFHLLKVNRYNKRKPSSIHGDVFQGGFGDFEPLKKRRPESDVTGLEHGVFNEFGGFNTLRKRVPELSSSGFHSDVFNGGFGDFETLRKRVPEGFHHDIFNGGFGNFETLRKRVPESVNGDAFNRDFGQFTPLKRKNQFTHKPRINFNGDAFYQDFGYFDTVKRRPEAMNADAFHSNFGAFEPLKRNDDFQDYFDTLNKRKISSELDADMFHTSFGNFEPLKKRKPYSSFDEDTFHDQFGNFDTLKKRKPDDFNSDAFHSNFGNFNTMKRRPDMFNGDAFHSSFGNFDTLRKRVPEINSAGFHPDLFTGGFGSFDVSKRTQRLDKDPNEMTYRAFKNLLHQYMESESKSHNGTDLSRINVHSNSSLAND